MTKTEHADAHLAAIWANQLRLKKLLGHIDAKWLVQIIEDMQELQIENENHRAKEAEIA